MCSLASLLAVELKADLLMLMTDVEGLFTGPPSDPCSQLISTYCPKIHDPLIQFGAKSAGGRGGMLAKVHSRLTTQPTKSRVAELRVANAAASSGTGGIMAENVTCVQVSAAWKAASGGVTTVIASGKSKDSILQAASGETSRST